jgi:roadblock/LC7 domain-containing protein
LAAPVGSAIAFTASSALKIVPASGGAVVDIDSGEWSPRDHVRFTPDGKTIFYRTLSSSGPLRWAPIDGSAQFSSSANVDTWSVADASTIVASRYDTSVYKYVIDAITLATGATTRVSSDANSTWVSSPDGKLVAYRTFSSSGVGVTTIATVAGGAPTTVTAGTAGYTAPPQMYFSPDSAHLFFFTDGSTLYTVPASGGTATKLGTGIVIPYSSYVNTKDPLVFSADSASAYFVAGSDLKKASVDGATIVTLASPAAPADLTSAKGGVALSPDGKTIAYFGDGSATMYVPTSGVGAPIALVDVASYVEWLGSSFVVSYRTEPAPLSFQSGVYTTGVP